MTWLANLLGIDAPENTTLKSAVPDFRSVWSTATITFVLLAAVVFIGLTFLLYFRERGRLGWVRRSLMAVLRVGILLLLLMLLLRPVLLVEFAGERSRNIALLLDDSKSMQQIDKRTILPDRIRLAIAKDLLVPTNSIYDNVSLGNFPATKRKDEPRIELLKAVLKNPKLDLLNGLQKRGPLRAFVFGEHVRSELAEKPASGETKSFAEQLQTQLTAGQPKTALGDALLKLVTQPGTELPAAIVVATDGRNNSGTTQLMEAAEECKRAGVPLYIYGVGSSEGGTLQILDVPSQETIFYDDIVPVPIHWKAMGFKKGQLKIEVFLGGKKVADKMVDVKNGRELRDVLTFTPKKTENYGSDPKLKVVLHVEGNGQDNDTDTLTKNIRLSDSKVKVLYIENGPRWEFKFLQPMLSRDKRLQVDFILVNGDPRLMKNRPFLPTFPKREDLLKYDLVILGDVPAGYLDKNRRVLLREYVRDFRGGMIVIAGSQNNPRGYDGTELNEVLPVEFLPVEFKFASGLEDDAQRPVAFQPKLTREGEMADMLALSDVAKENLQIWKTLPGFYWHYPVTKLRPAATALLVHPYKKTGKKPMPLLAQHFYGRGQVLFLATDETWRWRYNVEDKYYSRFWGQLIYKMALPHLLGNSSQRSQFAVERSEAILNREGYLYVRLLDKEYRPLKQPQVSAVLEYHKTRVDEPGTETVTFEAIPNRPGEYRLFRKHSRPGMFDVKFLLPGHSIEKTFSYRVKLPPRHELEEAGLAEEELSEAARISGGKFYREEDLYHLVSDVAEKKTKYVLRQEILLWNPLMFLVFVGLITTEWVVRKFANLS